MCVKSNAVPDLRRQVYRCEEGKNNRLSIFVSYGGLLMSLSGDARNLQGVNLDSMIYLLIRKF